MPEQASAPRRDARLLFVIGSLGPGGSERQLLYLVSALRKRGVSLCVAIWNFNETDVYVEPLRAAGAVLLPIEGRSRWAKLFELRRLIRAGGFAVVQSFSFYLNGIIAAATVRTGTHAIGCVRSSLALAIRESGPVLGSVSSRWPRVQIYNSTFAANEARRRRWWRPRSIEVVPNQIDVDMFPDLPVPRGGAIVAVGSLLPVKRWDRLLGLAVRLRDRGVVFQVRIAGDGPLRSWLESEIARLELDSRITLLGYVRDVKRILGESALLLHVSESEGSPNVVIEALAAGRPVVATDVGDVAQLVSDGETGFVVPFADEEMLVDRVSTLLTDHERCATMGRRARQVARERFGTSTLAAETLQAYRNLGGTVVPIHSHQAIPGNRSR